MKSIGILEPPPLALVKGSVSNDRFLVQDKGMSVGEVYDTGISKEPCFDFFQLLIKNGYATRNSTYYSSLSLTYCKGSIELHRDERFGLVALWLVNVKPLHKSQQGIGLRPSFYSSRQWLELRIGEIIIFDASKEHAWLSNYHCSMIIQTVRRVRRTGHVESN